MIMAPTAPMAYKACSELSMSGNAMPESKQQQLELHSKYPKIPELPLNCSE